ncbi:hypothetical protein AB833_06615 [Chromatiales bacterium (ex Bugula neritina AB1)]|nr:hypothetical protein AB833_06615 [Chromatiales bacterium (ex Bugula neritina AB1)]
MREGAAITTETAERAAAVNTIIDTSRVRSIDADLGVNRSWRESSAPSHATGLVIPAYQGAAEVAKMALIITLWAEVKDYLYDNCAVAALDSQGEEKKHLAILNESETMIICLLCLLNNEPYTAGGLVDAMLSSEASSDQRGNARKRLINRTLPVIAGRYKLLQFRESNKGNLREYSIARSVRLARFAEEVLVGGVRRVTGEES